MKSFCRCACECGRTRFARLPLERDKQVVTVVPEGIAYSHILAPEQLPPDVRRFSTVIADVARTGNSGSGVFDLKERCLLGIMSRMITKPIGSAAIANQQIRDIAKYFVPAAEITEFLAGRATFALLIIAVVRPNRCPSPCWRPHERRACAEGASGIRGCRRGS